MNEAARHDSSPEDAGASAGRPADEEAEDFPEDDAPLYCRICGYPVNKLGHPICPECGTDFDPDDPYSVETSPVGTVEPAVRLTVGVLHRVMTIIILVGFAVALLVAIALIISEILDG